MFSVMHSTASLNLTYLYLVAFAFPLYKIVFPNINSVLGSHIKPVQFIKLFQSLV